jgi:hypothetical protein
MTKFVALSAACPLCHGSGVQAADLLSGTSTSGEGGGAQVNTGYRMFKYRSYFV